MIPSYNNGAVIDSNDVPSIPTIRQGVNAGNYREIPVDTRSSLYSEELVDLRDYGIAGISYYHISDGTNHPYCQQLEGSIPSLLARKSIAEMLAKVNIRLEPLGLELFVWDAYRPLATQIGIWNFFKSALQRENPSFQEEAIRQEVIKYVSDPNSFNANNSRTWPTHMTGASVDLSIRRKPSHEILNLGAHFDQMDQTAHTDYFEHLLANGAIDDSDPRLLNRRTLYHFMTKEGFTNYPLEYWHFDWGNQMYQMIKSLQVSGSIEPAFYGIFT